MAINRALMNRQMYNMGGSSLEAGAPDITLTGDMRPTYSAMRKQRLAGGGIAGLQNRQGYFLGKLVDKIRDDIIPNEIKENPLISALGGAALLNQFGLPDFITEAPVIGDYLSDDFGKNFLGNLINKDLVIGPGGEQISDLPDANVGLEVFDIPKESTGGYFPSLPRFEVGSGYYGEQIPELIRQTIGIGPDTTNMTTNQRNQLALEQYKRKNLQADLAKALAVGSAAGAYVESQPKDTLPTDTTGVNFQTAQQAMDDPNLRFKPPLEATQLAANGGRMGYNIGGGVEMDPILKNFLDSQDGMFYVRESIKQGKSLQQIINDLEGIFIKDMDPNFTKQIPERAIGMDPGFTKQLPERTIDIDPDFEIQLRSGGAQGGRVPAQEGGLMDLGGMEKDYREEGGFVPIGGREKADDVPARLSKNEFVFTADAVRNAGGGDIDEGAAIMERMMKNLEQGGQVSEESQGLEGAREMFETSQRLEKRII